MQVHRYRYLILTAPVASKDERKLAVTDVTENHAGVRGANASWTLFLTYTATQMTDDERTRLTWEDATQRFLDVAELSPAELANPIERGFDRAAWMLHNSLNSARPCIVIRLGFSSRMCVFLRCRTPAPHMHSSAVSSSVEGSVLAR